MKSKYLLLLLPLIFMACRNPVPANQVQSAAVKPAIGKPEHRSASAISQPSTVKAIPDRDVSGYYEEADDEQEEGQATGCDIAVAIQKVRVGYRYRLTSGQTQHTGKITLERNSDQTAGIVFEGIPYAEYEEDVSNLEDSDERPQPKIPLGVGGVMKGDTIMIQNYGNAMNYYVQFGGCEVKFLRLIRRPRNR